MQSMYKKPIRIKDSPYYDMLPELQPQKPPKWPTWVRLIPLMLVILVAYLILQLDIARSSQSVSPTTSPIADENTPVIASTPSDSGIAIATRMPIMSPTPVVTRPPRPTPLPTAVQRAALQHARRMET